MYAKHNNTFVLISEWCRHNRLCVNYKKTNYMVFHLGNKKFNTNLILNMDNHIIEHKAVIEFLGIFLGDTILVTTYYTTVH